MIRLLAPPLYKRNEREKQIYVEWYEVYSHKHTPTQNEKEYFVIEFELRIRERKKSIFVRFHENFPTLKRMSRKRVSESWGAFGARAFRKKKLQS